MSSPSRVRVAPLTAPKDAPSLSGLWLAPNAQLWDRAARRVLNICDAPSSGNTR